MLAAVVRGRSFLDLFEQRPDESAQFYVLDRKTGTVVATADADPFFVYHHVNAYKTGGELVIDLIAYPDERAVTGLTMDNLRSEQPDLPQGDLVRYRVPLNGRTVNHQLIREGPMEFPMIHYQRYNGRAYQYVYAAEMNETSSLPARLVKINVESSNTVTWNEPRTYPDEPMFVAAPEPNGEDDGVVLSLVLDGDEERSFLLCLDEESLEEVGRAYLPHRLPYGFHGQFYDRDEPNRSMA
jgi:carotenoid cleavage dioxygenase-like enzyme